MTRSDLIDHLTQRFGNLTKNDAELAVTTMLEALEGALVAGGRVEIRGFGGFSVKHRAARIGRNPRALWQRYQVLHLVPVSRTRDAR